MSHRFTIFFILVLAFTAYSQDEAKILNKINLQIEDQEPVDIQEESTQAQEPLAQDASDIPTNNQPSNSTNETNSINETYIECVKRAVGYTAVATAVGGGATAAVGSTAALSAVGFTSGGVAAGSIAAGVQSAVAVVEAGSIFAYLQSAGAMATGVFGAAFLPITIGVGAVAGSGYLYSQCGLPV